MMISVLRWKDPWNYRRSNFYGYIFGIQSYSLIDPQKDPLLLSYLWHENSGTRFQIVLSLTCHHSRFICTWASFQFCWVHCAFHLIRIAETLEHLASRSLRTIGRPYSPATSGRLGWPLHFYSYGPFSEGRSSSQPFYSFSAFSHSGNLSRSIRKGVRLRIYTVELSSWSKYFQYS